MMHQIKENSKRNTARILLLEEIEKGLDINNLRKGFAVSFAIKNEMLTSDVNNAIAAIRNAPPVTPTVVSCLKAGMTRLTPPHERAFCKELNKFIVYLLELDFKIPREEASGLIFGTQTVASVTPDGAVAYDNLYVVTELCEYVKRAKMIVGNLRKEEKAKVKVDDWKSVYDLRTKLGNNVFAGPVNAENLELRVEEHFGWNAKEKLIVLMMDSGGGLDYEDTFVDLTKKFANDLYIIKMKRDWPEFNILRALNGELKTAARDKIFGVIEEVRKNGLIACGKNDTINTLWR